MEKPTTTVITRSINKGQHDWNLDAIYRVEYRDNIDGHLKWVNKLRISIRRNAYDHQSHARIEVFEPHSMKWNFLAHIPYTDMESMAFSYVESRGKAEPFLEADEDELLRMANDILA